MNPQVDEQVEMTTVAFAREWDHCHHGLQHQHKGKEHTITPASPSLPENACRF